MSLSGTDYQNAVDVYYEDDFSSVALLLEEMVFKIGHHDGEFPIEDHPAIMCVVSRLYELISGDGIDKEDLEEARDMCLARVHEYS